MLKFSFLLQHYVRNGFPYAALVFQHVVESIVFVPVFIGVLFFFIEFYADRVLAFMIISLVWLSEVYCVICVRTLISLQYFPRIFFMILVLYNIYFCSFPLGFSHVVVCKYTVQKYYDKFY
jgi:hypothetical protein